MDKDNPACYECPKTKNSIHAWSPIYTNEIRTNAICVHCGLILNKEQTNDLWRE
jgi:hypothetical protein